MHSEKICIEECECIDITREQMDGALLESEKIEYEEIPVTKRQEWLGGRICAKRAIQRHAKEKYSVEIPTTEIEIIKQDGKVPLCKRVSSESFPLNLDDVLLSISHSHAYAVACVADKSGCSGLGVDTERIRSFSVNTLSGFLNDEEYNQYSKTPTESKPMVATRYWCIKEAYLKAKGVGLRVHPRRIFVDMEGASDILIREDGYPTEAKVNWTIKKDLYILVTILL